jgi:hypothetical protein
MHRLGTAPSMKKAKILMADVIHASQRHVENPSPQKQFTQGPRQQ